MGRALGYGGGTLGGGVGGGAVGGVAGGNGSISSTTIDEPPAVLFATDLNPLRQFVLHGFLPQLRSINMTVHHVALTRWVGG